MELNEYINNYRKIGASIFIAIYKENNDIERSEELAYKECEKWAYNHTGNVNITSVDFYKYVVSILQLGVREALGKYL